METYVSGCYTVKDEELFNSPAIAMEVEDLFLEPSSQPVKIIIKPPNPYKDLEVFIFIKALSLQLFSLSG